MARTTKPMSGAGQKKFFRDLFRADGEVPAAAVERLADRCEAQIAEIRVRHTAMPIRTNVAQKSAPLATAPHPAPPAQAGAEPQPAFDPFAFSVVALLAKKGKPALAARLAEIADPGELMAIAAAQHLGVDVTLLDIATLRDAIITGAERRIAERRAAAS